MSKTSVFKEIMRECDQDRQGAERLRERRLEDLYAACPRLREIDRELAGMGSELVKAVLAGGERAAELADIGAALNNERTELIAGLGYAPEYLEDVYKCGACRDTGFVDGERCVCLRQRLIERYYQISNLSRVLEKENFDAFDMSYYSEEIDPKTGVSPRALIMKAWDISQGFVANFDRVFDNLYLYGSTGLGKTFLCNCVAKELLDGGKTVIYLTAMQLFKLVEDLRFNRDEEDIDSGRMEMVYEADLLIIDDLGTEFATVVTSAEFFNIINTRLLKERHTIISSNLSPAELEEHYSDRVISRLFGNYKLLKFIGQDIRLARKYGGA